MAKQVKDIDGKVLKVGDRVVKAEGRGYMRIRTVEKIVNGQLYLDNARQPVRYLNLVAKIS